MSNLFGELKRRNVFRVAVAYVAVAWLVLQVLEVVVDGAGAPQWVMQVVLALLAIGFPIALVFSWAYEITPEGVKLEKDVERSESITPQTGQRLDKVIIGVLFVAVGFLLFDRLGDDGESLEQPEPSAVVEAEIVVDEGVENASDEVAQIESKSIAVLPFVNMSSDQEQEWFADGLTEEILNSLARTPDLLVSARTSSFAYKGSTERITTIANELGVEHILEGSVRRGGDTLRITAQLIRASDGFHIWSDTFDRTPDDIIAIQEEIAVHIAQTLGTYMDPKALAAMMSAGTDSVAAYDVYLTGLGFDAAAADSGDSYLRLEFKDSMEKAIEFDPTFADAWWRLGLFWWVQSQSNVLWTGLTDLPQEVIETNRDRAFAMAIENQSDRNRTKHYQATQAMIKLDFLTSAALNLEYVAQAPNDDAALFMLQNAMVSTGQVHEIERIARERLESEQLTATSAEILLQGLRSSTDEELIRALSRYTVERFGSHTFALYQAHRTLLFVNDIDTASRILPRIMASDLDEDNRLLVQLRQACAERRLDDALALQSEIQSLDPDNRGIHALTASIVGQDSAAEAIFREFEEDGDFATLANYLSYPQFDPTPYPKFMQRMAGQGIEDRQVRDLPYRCNR